MNEAIQRIDAELEDLDRKRAALLYARGVLAGETPDTPTAPASAPAVEAGSHRRKGNGASRVHEACDKYDEDECGGELHYSHCERGCDFVATRCDEHGGLANANRSRGHHHRHCEAVDR